MKKVISLSILFVITLVFNASAFEFTERVNPNGLTILHLNRQNIPAVAITLLIDASPFNEPKDKAGLAHITGKMLLEGTLKRSSRQINEEIDYIGASLSVNTNHDYTTLSLTVLKKDLEKAFDILSDVLINPTFDEKEIEKRKTLTIGSLRQREEEPSYVAKKEFIKKIFSDHPYGRQVSGSEDTIRAITRGDILSFYKDRFRPKFSILSVAGDITLDELQKLLDKHLNKWTNRDDKNETKGNEFKIKKQLKREIVILNRQLTQANIIFGHLGVKRDNPDFYALTVMNYILGGGGFASRLMKSVRDDLGLTYGISSYFSLSKDIGSFNIEVQTKNESTKEVVNEIKRQIDLLQKEYVSEQELRDAKSFLIGSFPRRLETNIKIADFLALIYFYKLGKDYIKKYPDYINSVTLEDIKRVAQKYLTSQNYTLVITGRQDLISSKEMEGN